MPFRNFIRACSAASFLCLAAHAAEPSQAVSDLLGSQQAAVRAASAFPAHLPSSNDYAQIDSWIAEFESRNWTPKVKVVVDERGVAQGKARWAIGLKSVVSDCDNVTKTAELDVENGAALVRDEPHLNSLQSYRGEWGSCGPAGRGAMTFADGRRYVGQIATSGGGTKLDFHPSGLGLWLLPDGRRQLLDGKRGELSHGVLAFGAPGQWWAKGEFDQDWNTADGLYAAPDGSAFRGELRGARPAGRGAWRDARSKLEVRGDAVLEGDAIVFRGAVEVELTASTKSKDGSALPAGRYAYDAGAGWKPTRLPEASQLLPYAETLRAAARSGSCAASFQAPSGWKIWWPSCTQTPAGPALSAYSADGRYRFVSHNGARGTTAGAMLLEVDPAAPLVAQKTWIAERFEMTAPPAPVGKTRYLEGSTLAFVGPIAKLAPSGSGLCPKPAEEGEGMEACQIKGGERVDPIAKQRIHLALQRKAEAERQAAALAAAQHAEQERQAQLATAAAAQPKSGFQWGKFAALTVGVAAGGIDKLDSQAQADILTGIVKDSMSGQDGMSGLQAATAAVGAGTASAGPYTTAMTGGAASGAVGAGKGAVAPGSYPARPNTLDGDPACRGYSVDNYKQYYSQNSNGPDAQLHALCAGAYNYYWMYLNAIRQGYNQADSDRTYAAFSDAALVATDFYQKAR